jgi:23S rRNA G2445 N2-methylase RlmL
MHLCLVDRGLEEFTAEDILRKAGGRAIEVASGRVCVEIENPEELLRCRSINRILVNCVRSHISDPESIRGIQLSLDAGFSYRAISTRTGDHGFKSVDITRVAHEIMGERVRIDYKSPDRILHFAIFDDICYVGEDLGGDLSKRDYKIFNHNDSLKATIAYYLVRLSGFSSGMSLLDPFCGCGTIPIEAALEAEGEVYASDFQSRHIRNSAKNASAASVRIKFLISTIDALSFDKKIDIIITHPPTHTNKQDRTVLMEKFFTAADRILKEGGKIILIHNHPLIKTNPFMIVRESVVYQGQEKKFVMVMSR